MLRKKRLSIIDWRNSISVTNNVMYLKYSVWANDMWYKRAGNTVMMQKHVSTPVWKWRTQKAHPLFLIQLRYKWCMAHVWQTWWNWEYSTPCNIYVNMMYSLWASHSVWQVFFFTGWDMGYVSGSPWVSLPTHFNGCIVAGRMPPAFIYSVDVGDCILGHPHSWKVAELGLHLRPFCVQRGLHLIICRPSRSPIPIDGSILWAVYC